jgi:hypothetical protein
MPKPKAKHAKAHPKGLLDFQKGNPPKAHLLGEGERPSGRGISSSFVRKIKQLFSSGVTTAHWFAMKDLLEYVNSYLSITCDTVL